MKSVSMPNENNIDRNLALEVVRVTEAAALAASKFIGRGDKIAADGAAVDAMRSVFNTLYIDGTVVIGEGEKDEAPQLYTGERVGIGKGPKVDIALDPLEGTDATANGDQGAMCVVAMTDNGGFLHAPDVYMDKLSVGFDVPADAVSLDALPKNNLREIARAKKMDMSDLCIAILNRPRNQELIAKVREAGARILLFPHVDVPLAIAVSQPDTGIHAYMGIGGAPEGVLSAAALQCIGGSMQGRLWYRHDQDRDNALKMGIKDLNKVYSIDELAYGENIMFAATGVTDGVNLRGVRRYSNYAETHSIVMRSKSGTVRNITATHNFDKKSDYK